MKKLICLLLAGLLTLGLAACGEKEPPAPSEYPVTAGDFIQNEAPTGVISLTPAITEMMEDLGLASLLRGVSDYCDMPKLPAPPAPGKDEEAPPPPEPPVRVGTVYEPDWDAIAAHPDALVVTSVPLPEQHILKLQQAGYTVLTLPRADSVAGIKENYLALGRILAGNHTGKEAADAVIAHIDSALAAASASLSALPSPMDAALLTAYPYSMATGDTLEGKLLVSIGFTGSGDAYTDWLYPKEDLRSLEPDVIFCAREEDVKTVLESYEYKSVPAAKNKKVTAIDFTAFQNQTLRMFDTLVEMASFAAAPVE